MFGRAEMAALQGVLGCSALGCLSLCAEFCFGFVFLSPLKVLYFLSGCKEKLASPKGPRRHLQVPVFDRS